jgi:hypothetical protein
MRRKWTQQSFVYNYEIVNKEEIQNFLRPILLDNPNEQMWKIIVNCSPLHRL